MHKRRGIRSAFPRLLLALFCVSFSGCTSVSYYQQAISGHLRLMFSAQPIATVIDTLPQSHAELLISTPEILAFAEQQLSLPANGSYQSFVQLPSSAPVFNVIAALPLSLDPKRWCFPIAGCVPYRGYFSRKRADQYAKKLENEGYDVFVSPAVAYSTLGWFDDPVLSSMLASGRYFYLELIFHELTHQRLYLPRRSDFNEALATAVAEYGVRKWLSIYEPDRVQAYQQLLQRRARFYAFIEQDRQQLATLYSSDLSESDKLLEKRRLLASMGSRFSSYAGLDQPPAWFKETINNARLALLATYRDLVPAFSTLIDQCDGNMERFYQLFSRQPKNAGRELPENCLNSV